MSIQQELNSIPSNRTALALSHVFTKIMGSGTVAATGSSQATAAAASNAINAVTGADATKAVRLPVPTPGDPGIWVINTDSSSALPIYPNVGGKINAIATNSAYTLAAAQATFLIASSATQWYTGIVGATSAQIAFLTGAVAGAGAVSKVMVADSNGDFIMPDNGHFIPSVATVAAAGTGVTAADATVLADQNNPVTGATGVAGVALPAAATGLPITVYNTNTRFALLVWPVSAGNDLINEQEANTPFVLPPRKGATFIATSATQWYVDNYTVATSLQTKATTFDDFQGVWAITNSESATLWSSTAGSGTANEIATTVANSLNGEITLKSSTAHASHAADATNLTGKNLAFKANQGGLAIEVRLKLNDVTNGSFFVGFTDTISTTVECPLFLTAADIDSDATDACGVGYDSAGTTKQFYHGGVKNNTDTVPAYSGGAPVADTYVTIRVEVSAAGSVRGFIDGVAIGAAVANAVTVTIALCPVVVVYNSTANLGQVTIDYIRTEQNR